MILEGRPEVFPVNYVLDDGSIVFRTAMGSKFWASLAETCALEVDGYSALSGKAWSVVVHARARFILDRSEKARVDSLRLEPWEPGEKAYYYAVDSRHNHRAPLQDSASRDMDNLPQRRAPGTVQTVTLTGHQHRTTDVEQDITGNGAEQHPHATLAPASNDQQPRTGSSLNEGFTWPSRIQRRMPPQERCALIQPEKGFPQQLLAEALTTGS